MLFEKAKDYEQGSFKGLYNFINFIDRVTKHNSDMGAPKLIGENEDGIFLIDQYNRGNLPVDVKEKLNADTEGFKKFIKSSQSVEMDCSQRCCHDVWKLANKLVQYGNSILKGAFYTLMMSPVVGKNPIQKEK